MVVGSLIAQTGGLARIDVVHTVITVGDGLPLFRLHLGSVDSRSQLSIFHPQCRQPSSSYASLTTTPRIITADRMRRLDPIPPGRGPFLDEVRLNGIDTIIINPVIQLDVDAVGVLSVNSHFDSGTMSRSKFGEGGIRGKLL